MPFVRITWWAGRSHKLKEEIAKAITDTLVQKIGVPPEAVWIVFNDIPKEDWAIGGVSCSESKT